MTRVSITRKIRVSDPLDVVPLSGYAKLIAQAGAHRALRPAGMTEASFDRALFEAYGSGTLVEDYSTAGAFVIAGSGGHDHAEIVGGVGFDFTARQWFSRWTPGYTETGLPTQFGDTTGSPWYELAGYSETPAPPHPYASMIQIRAADGGGSKGSVLHLGRAAVTNLSYPSHSAHRFDCDTGIWSRAAATVTTGLATEEGSAVFDPVTKRYYSIPGNFNSATSMRYLDATTWEWGSISYPTWPAAGTGWYHKGFYWAGNGKRLIVVMWGDVWQALDLDNLSAGWAILSTSVSGSLELPHTKNVPTWHQSDGNLYWRASSGAGNKIVRIEPPVNPITGTWTISEVTLLGDSIPEFMGGTVTTAAYKSLFYIPAYQCLGWVTAQGVALLNP